MAVRYPRGNGEGIPLEPNLKQLPIGKGEILREGQDVAILAIGSTVCPALDAAELLAGDGIRCTVVNARFAKPIDSELVLELATRTRRLVTVEENMLIGGFGSAVLESLGNAKPDKIRVECLGLPDRFIEHGPQEMFRSMFDLNAEGIARRVRSAFPELMVTTSARQQEEVGR